MHALKFNPKFKNWVFLSGSKNHCLSESSLYGNLICLATMPFTVISGTGNWVPSHFVLCSMDSFV